MEDGLTFHIRNRSGKGTLDGLLLHDTRDAETAFTYQADTGLIVEAADRTLLVMQKRHHPASPQTGRRYLDRPVSVLCL
ncbi:hypothetical protein QW131_06075 [Roseibium salinum]|nr:hypothetical protein [Roseibium salinum]